MAPMFFAAFAPRNQEISLPLPAAGTQSAHKMQAGRDRSDGFIGAFTKGRRRSWLPALAAVVLASTGAWAQGVFGVPQAVGTTSSAQNVTVTAQRAGKVNKVEVLTLGAPGLDFAGVSGASTCPAANLAAVGQQCMESVTFTPAAPGLRVGAVVLLDVSGNLLGTALLSGTGSGGLGALVSGNILPVAGNGNYKDAVVDGIAATKAELYLPSDVTLDGAGNLYIADTLHNRIRMVCASATSATISGTAAACTGAGIITTIAGNGDTGYTGDGTAASAATLSSPSGVALDGAGNLYISDTGNNVVRKIVAATGIITTVAGTGVPGYTADGIAATLSELNGPQSITVDSAGNLFIADTLGQRIRRVDAVSGIITTAAGNGTAGFAGDTLLATSVNTELNYPAAVAFDAQSNMYIADSLNNRVREVNGATGIITTFAGNGLVLGGDLGDGGAATLAELDAPSGVTVDAAGDVYIADTQNNAIREVTSAANAKPGIISTIAKNGGGEFYFNGAFSPVIIHGPLGIFLDNSANLYFADTFNNVVREMQSNFDAIDLTKTPTRQGADSATQDETVVNVGNAPLNLTAPDIFVDTNDPQGVNAALDAATTTCPTSNPFLADEADCVIGAEFAPSLSLVFGSGVSSEPLDANIDIGQSGDTLNSPLDIELVGVATPLNSTTVTLASSLNPSQFGQNVTFTATVTTGTGSLTGTVTFYNGAAILKANVALVAGAATYTTSTLPVGTNPITAQYNGDSTHFKSTVDAASTVMQVVNEATTTTLTSAPASPSALGASVTFTATVTSGGGGVPLDGTVTFTNGAVTLCNAVPLTLTAGVYTAVCSTTPATALAQGVNTIVAAYSGDVANEILDSKATINQDVQALSTITLSSNTNPSVYGNPVTFTVTVPTIGTVAATGTVNFYMAGQAAPLNPAPLSLATVAGTGTATFTTSSLPVSTVALPDAITAKYSGDSYYGSGTSNTVSQVVTQATTSTTVSAAPNPAVAGAPVTITATITVTSGVLTPTGNVNFTDSFNGGAATPLACAPQPTTVAPTCTTTALAAGSHSIVATYVGDTDDAGSQSAPFVLTVVAETISLSPSSNPSNYGAPVTFTVTVPTIGTAAATGTVNFYMAGQAAPLNPAPLSLATVAGAGTVTFTTSTLPAGTDVITASYLGGPSYIPMVSAPVNQVVNKATTSTAVASIPNPGIAGAAVAITATVAVTLGAATPTGTVSFTDSLNGAAAVALGTPVTLTGGTAIINPMLAPGTHVIVATYSGDANDNTSSGTFTLTVNQAATQTTVTATPNPALVQATVTFAATVTSVGGGTPTGTVTFNANGNPIGAAATLSATGTATITSAALAPGTYTITAVYSGDTNEQASTGTGAPPLVIGTIPTVTDLGASTTTGANPQVILVAAVLDNAAGNSGSLPVPTGTVTFNSGGTTLGSATLDSSGVATLVPSLANGTSYNIVAVYSGDSLHSPSTSATVSINGTASGFSLTVTPSAVTMAAGENVSVNVALTSINGFADTIGLGCASLPAGVNCQFSSPSSKLAANGVANVTLTIDTNNPLGGGTSAMNAHPGGRGVSLAGLLLPLSAFFGFVFWRLRRRYAGWMTLGLVLLLGVAAQLVTGCSGSFSQSSAAAGTYTIQVTGTGTTSDISHYQNVTLTISAK
jgi:large repetitive protein